MNKWLKRIGIVVGSLLLLGALFVGYFVFRVTKGMPFFETDVPYIEFAEGKKSILLFSKANGFVHGDAIDAGKRVFNQMATENDWFIYQTDEAGVFNKEQLAKFDAVIWNNVSGQVLTEEQRTDFSNYLENGGGLLGIHAAGDFSHHWQWYYDHVLGTTFSHHPLKPQLQEAAIHLEDTADSLTKAFLPASLDLKEEWYIFNKDPREMGANVLYAMDGDKIIPNGNLLWIKDKNWGMGAFHPNVWSMEIEKGKAFYVAPGHTAATFENADYIKVLKYGIDFVSKKE
ncbi:ThuA domain-containing protein [uncultured Arcticibacterium sp.]|mgnify:CR=1 FL=1|uniref:ThuA domain-containing protein n=1 Tax=uncultured Arcticibacterium sp. TaxID=2173042 RepID=UPI0030FC45EA